MIQILVQGGAIGIALALIAYAGWKDKIYNKTMNNHLEHFTAALDRNSTVLGQNNETNKLVCKVIERIENKLDKL